MSREDRYKRSSARPERQRLTAIQIVGRAIFLLVVIGLVAVAIALLTRNLNRTGTLTQVELPAAAVNPALTPAEATMLNLYLSANRAELNRPAGNDPSLLEFDVQAGQTANLIAANLQAAGLINNETLFVRYVRYYGLDSRLEAGTYQLAATQSIAQIALALTNSVLDEVEIRLTEGWRREQMADYIVQQEGLPVSGVDFLTLTGPGSVPSNNSLAAELPLGASLEGFLFPDTYSLAPDGNAANLVALMLDNFERRVTSQMRADAVAGGLSLYEVVTLASIVEREAVVAEERPLIASVYLNRLALNMKLEADPTVQYAQGYQAESGEWWNLNLTRADYTEVISTYNTYLNAGLPPGPIANPGLSSIEAVIYPAQLNYLFFRAACDGSGRHSFAATFEEHVANGC